MDFLFPSAEYCIAYILAIATLQGPLSSCLALPCLALPCLALPCLALPCLALPCLALPCLALPCLALPCLALPCLALPCLALPWACFLVFWYLLVYLDYLSALPCWMLFADRRPTLALGLLFVLPVLFLSLNEPVLFCNHAYEYKLAHGSARLTSCSPRNRLTVYMFLVSKIPFSRGSGVIWAWGEVESPLVSWQL